MSIITKAIIPVAGLGTRFLPATKAQPKEMLPLVDKPIIQYVVEEAAEAGIRSIFFVTGRGKQSIENHFDVAYELEQSLRQKGRATELKGVQKINQILNYGYVRQGELLGLGHAIRCAELIADGKPIAVLLADDVFCGQRPALRQLLDVHAHTNMAVVGVQEVSSADVNRYGIVSAPNEPCESWPVNSIVEKPMPGSAPSNFAVVGRYVLTPEVFEILASLPPGHDGEYQLTDALAVMAQRGRLMATNLTQHHFDTGNKLDYLKASIDFALARPEFATDMSAYIQSKASELQAIQMTGVKH